MRNKHTKFLVIQTVVVYLGCFLIGPATHAEVVLDGSVGPAATLQGPDYKITQDHGSTAGNNLFHSFEAFSVNAGESATFYSSPAIENIINRVTGDQASWIDGPLRGRLSGTDTLSSANLYFLNPNGILFGSNASLDIGGSFHASTAEHLEFDNGDVFSAGTEAGTQLLSAANPAAFGFLGKATLELRGAIIESSHDINLSGGAVALREGASLITRAVGTDAGGDITLVAEQEITLSGHDVSGDGSRVETNTSVEGTGGKVNVEAPIIKLQDGAIIRAGTDGPGKGGALALTANERVSLSGYDADGYSSSLQATTSAAGDAGTLSIQAPVIELQDGAAVVANTEGAGKSGELVVIASERLTLSGRAIKESENIHVPENTEEPVIYIKNGSGSSLQASALADGDAGRLYVEAAVVELQDGAFMSANTSGTGQSGELLVKASERVTLAGFNSEGRGSVIRAVAFNEGDAGTLHIDAPVIELQDGGFLSTSALGLGRGGDIVVTASERFVLSGVDKVKGIGSSLWTAAVFGDGDAGTMHVEAPVVELRDGALITTGVWGAGQGGELTVNASEYLTLTGVDGQGNGARLSSATFSEDGSGGRINIQAPVISLSHGAMINSSSKGVGNAGPITISAIDSLQMTEGSAITAEALKSSGGDISIQVGHTLYMQDSHITTDVSSGDGGGGNVTIGTNMDANLDAYITPKLVVLNHSQITANADAGQGGEIRIVSDHLFVSTDSIIDASAGPAEIEAAPNTDIGGTFAGLPVEFLNTAEFLKNGCAGRVSGQASSFVVNGVSSVNTGPDHFLSARVVDALPALNTASTHHQVVPLQQGLIQPKASSGNLLARLSILPAVLDWTCANN